MSKLFRVLDTAQGQVYVLTKSRYLLLFLMPRTTGMPVHATELGRVGTMLKWTTNDPTILRTLHEAVMQLVNRVGISGLRQIADVAKVSEQALGSFGGDKGIRTQWVFHQMAEMAAERGDMFELPDEILKHIKSVV